MLLLSRKDVESVLGMREALDAVRLGLRELSAGRAAMAHRLALPIAEHGGTYLTMAAYLPALELVAAKLIGHYDQNTTRYGLPTLSATLMLIRATDGAPISFMDASYITGVRTGAIAGVGVDVLARKDARVVGVIGTGVQARSNLQATCAVRSVETVRVYGRDEQRREDFAREMAQELAVEVRTVGSAREAVEGAHIVLATTTSNTPVVKGEWLSEGCHVSAVGAHEPDARELDTAVMRRASKIVLDGRDAVMAEAGDILIPIREGVLSVERIHGELGEVLLGKIPGRTDDREITVMKSVGLAVLDVAAAATVYRRAKEAGLGTEVSLV